MLSLKKREKSVDFFLVLFTLGRLGSGASSIFTQLRYYPAFVALLQQSRLAKSAGVGISYITIFQFLFPLSSFLNGDITPARVDDR